MLGRRVGTARIWRRKERTTSAPIGRFFVAAVAVWHISDQGEKSTQTLHCPTCAERRLLGGGGVYSVHASINYVNRSNR